MRLRILVGSLLICFLYTSAQEKRGGCRSKNRNRYTRNANVEVGGNGNENARAEAVAVTPWPGNEKCGKFQVKYATKGTYQPALLIMERGQQVRQLKRAVQASTGVFIDGVKRGKRRGGKEPAVGTTILQVHPLSATRKPSGTEPGPKILVLRNPLQTILRNGGVKLLRDNNSRAARTVLVARARRWIRAVKHWANSETKGKLLIIQAVEFFNNPRHVLDQIHKFLNVPVNEERVQCVLEDLSKIAATERSRQRWEKVQELWKKAGRNVQAVTRILNSGEERINKALAKQATNTRTVKLNLGF